MRHRRNKREPDESQGNAWRRCFECVKQDFLPLIDVNLLMAG